MSSTLAVGPAHAPPAHAAAEDLERVLGDPRHPDAPFSFREVVRADERDEMPHVGMAAIREWGFHHLLVPEQFGGRLRSLEELYAICRSLARRSATATVAYGSCLLGANPVWLWGSPQQRAHVAEHLLAGSLIGFAVSEADHGSDVRGGDFVAARTDDHYLLTGAKWPVGNATRGRFLTVCAKTNGTDFSLLLVDKQEIDASRCSNLPFVKTLGLRGHDLSGVTFDRCPVPVSAVIGSPGIGITQVLKTLQITRTAISALSLGPLDTAVRISLEYAQTRRLYGGSIYDLPIIRDHLVKAYVDLLIGECLAIPATRALTLAPGRLSLWSSVAKYFVPVTAEEGIASMATVLGARHYLREGVADGVFQKLQRDHAIASVFEGTTHVNLLGIAEQLPFVLARGADGADGADQDRLLASLFSRVETEPVWQPDGRRLQLTNGGRDEITQGWRRAVGRLDDLARRPDAPSAHRALLALVARIEPLRAECYARMGELPTGTAAPRAFALAHRHCVFHAMASCLYTWLYNRERVDDFFASGEWLVLCLERLLQRLQPEVELTEDYVDIVERRMLADLEENRMFSLTPVRLGS